MPSIRHQQRLTMGRRLAGLLTWTANAAIGWTAAAQAKPRDIYSTMVNYIDQSGILPGTEKNPERVVGVLIYTLLGFLGILFFVLIIYGGFLWMTARGAEDQITKAKKIITSASIGLAVVLSAYLISYIVLQLLIMQTTEFIKG